MNSTSNQDPWYVHAGLYAVVLILVIILIKVAIIDPREVVEKENYNRAETRLRMTNLKEAQILWEKKHGRYTDNLDSLINFIHSPFADSIRNSFDSLTLRAGDPFVVLTHGEFTPESLFFSPKSGERFSITVDTTLSIDTVVTTRGRFLRVDTTLKIGTRYIIEDPNGYGTIGSIENEALKNTASWE
ncbi:MAG: hypothetical protein R6W68_12510 [Ignavibacteriaceae bacterium]